MSNDQVKVAAKHINAKEFLAMRRSFYFVEIRTGDTRHIHHIGQSYMHPCSLVCKLQSFLSLMHIIILLRFE